MGGAKGGKTRRPGLRQHPGSNQRDIGEGSRRGARPLAPGLGTEESWGPLRNLGGPQRSFPKPWKDRRTPGKLQRSWETFTRNKTHLKNHLESCHFNTDTNTASKCPSTWLRDCTFWLQQCDDNYGLFSWNTIFCLKNCL